MSVHHLCVLPAKAREGTGFSMGAGNQIHVLSAHNHCAISVPRICFLKRFCAAWRESLCFIPAPICIPEHKKKEILVNFFLLFS